MEDLSDSKRGQIVGAHLAGASVYRERQFLRLCRRTRIMGRQRQRRGTVGEILALREWDRRTLRRIISKNHRTTAAQVTGQQNWIFILKTKTVRRELHKSSFQGRISIAKSLITESKTQMRKRWRHDHKTWTSDNWKRAHHMTRWVVLHAVPYIWKSLRLEKTQGWLQFVMCSSSSETRGRFCDCLGSNIVVQYSVGPNTWSNIMLIKKYVQYL
jgi:hypothetical protein